MGPAASLAVGVAESIDTSFEVEGGTYADRADIRALHGALHAPTRTSDSPAWRRGIEVTFAVDVFLEWLALSAIIEHWDTYGGMLHNYYLYNNPATNKLTWISWDHNFILAGDGVRQPDGPPPADRQAERPAGGITVVTFDKKEVGENWPLIRFLLDDPVYYGRYKGFLNDAVESTFQPDKLAAKYLELAGAIRPTLGADEAIAFDAAISALTTATRDRHARGSGHGGQGYFLAAILVSAVSIRAKPAVMQSMIACVSTKPLAWPLAEAGLALARAEA